MRREHILPVKQITSGPKHHFFGYYDKRQWDPTNRYILTYEVDFADRSPQANDVLGIGIIDTMDDYSLRLVAASRAWCWQQGCMLQWVPGSPHKIVYNDRVGDRFVAKILDVDSGVTRVLPRPVYTISDNAQWALSVNFSRLAVTRPGYGYNGLRDHWQEDPAPEDDGIYLMDVSTGDHRLILSVAELANYAPLESMIGAKHWFNHLLFNPKGERFIFLHRWAQPGGRFQTRLCTVDLSGKDLFVSRLDQGSHFIWFDDHRILIWGYTPEEGHGYYLVEDRTDQLTLVGRGVLTRDGHCTVSLGKDWILTDEYPDANSERPLILYRLYDGVRIDIGRFFSPKAPTEELRCDLHPRWSNDGKQLCIDSMHLGSRQMFVIDVSEITG